MTPRTSRCCARTTSRYCARTRFCCCAAPEWPGSPRPAAAACRSTIPADAIAQHPPPSAAPCAHRPGPAWPPRSPAPQHRRRQHRPHRASSSQTCQRALWVCSGRRCAGGRANQVRDARRSGRSGPASRRSNTARAAGDGARRFAAPAQQRAFGDPLVGEIPDQDAMRGGGLDRLQPRQARQDRPRQQRRHQHDHRGGSPSKRPAQGPAARPRPVPGCREGRDLRDSAGSITEAPAPPPRATRAPTATPARRPATGSSTAITRRPIQPEEQPDRHLPAAPAPPRGWHCAQVVRRRQRDPDASPAAAPARSARCRGGSPPSPAPRRPAARSRRSAAPCPARAGGPAPRPPHHRPGPDRQRRPQHRADARPGPGPVNPPPATTIASSRGSSPARWRGTAAPPPPAPRSA